MQRYMQMIYVITLGLLFATGCYAGEGPSTNPSIMIPYCGWPADVDAEKWKIPRPCKYPALLSEGHFAADKSEQWVIQRYADMNESFSVFCGVLITKHKEPLWKDSKSHLDNIVGTVDFFDSTKTDSIEKCQEELLYIKTVVMPRMEWAKTKLPKNNTMDRHYDIFAGCLRGSIEMIHKELSLQKKDSQIQVQLSEVQLEIIDARLNTFIALSKKHLALKEQQDQLIKQLEAKISEKDGQLVAEKTTAEEQQKVPEIKIGNSPKEIITEMGIGALFGGMLAMIVCWIFLRK